MFWDIMFAVVWLAVTSLCGAAVSIYPRPIVWVAAAMAAVLLLLHCTTAVLAGQVRQRTRFAAASGIDRKLKVAMLGRGAVEGRTKVYRR
jgi:hypothetical protein